MLVVRPAPQPTESLMAYVLRLTEANGYPSISYILGDMRKRKFQGTIGRLDSSLLMPIAGIDPEQADRLSMRFPERDNRATIALCNQPVSTLHIRINAPKVCPLCLAQFGRCEAFWELSLAVQCPLHDVALIDACSACGKSLRWYRTSVRMCPCGADLATQKSNDSFSKNTTKLMRLMRSKLYGEEDELAAKAFPVVSNLQFEELLDVIGLLCKWIAKPIRSDGKTRAMHTYSGHIDVVSEALSEWPKNFRRFLSTQFSSVVDAPALPQFKNCFRWVLDIADRAGNELAGEFRKEIYLYAAQYWPRTSLTRPGIELPISRDAYKWGGVVELTSFSGLHPFAVKRHISNGAVNTRTVETSRGKLKTFYELDWARTAAKNRSETISVQDAAKRLGMTVRILKELRRRGVYKTFHHGYGAKGGFILADIGELELTLLKRARARGVNSPRTGLKLRDVLKSSRRSPKRKADLVVAILDGTVRAWKGGHRSCVGTLLVSKASINAHFGDTGNI